MTFFINPGAGPVESATLDQAIANMLVFVLALKLPGEVSSDRGTRDEGGRFEFSIQHRDRSISVLMPGVSLEVLRSRDGFAPRLYVDGNSWYWNFAVAVVRDALRGAS